jgi:VIT1/CCC1 family predicted Fe2+/Mn2+ transporter
VSETEDGSTVVFGLFDGTTSALGVIVATAATGNAKAVIVASVALAVGAAVSMAAGQWLSDTKRSLRRALVMGLATLLGSILPAVPFFAVSGFLAWVCCGVVTVALASLIAEVRPGAPLPSYAITFTVLTVAAGLAIAASLAAGAVA